MNMKFSKLTFVILFSSFIGGMNFSYAQDECTNAPNIPIELYSTCGEMALQSLDLGDASPSTTAPAPTCASFNSGSTNDSWYSFMVPSGVNEMAFHAFNSDYVPMLGSSKPGLAVYRGTTCSDLTLINCFESEGAFMENQEIRWEIIPDLIPGETIWLRIWDEDNTAQQLFVAASVRLDMEEDNCDTPPEMGTGGCNILSTGGDITAPEQCGWNSTDNTIFYNFTVTAEDSQPYEIYVQNGECQANGGTGEDPEIQFAIYQWNGVDCTGIGGAGSTYMGCANGVGDVTFSQNLPPGDYVLAMDGYSMLSGNSLCTYGFSAPFIDLNLIVELNTSDAICGQGGSAAITVLESCSPSYEINWSNGASGTEITGLTQGSYSVTVTDDTEDCDTVINFNIGDEGNLVVNATATGDICNGPFNANVEVEGINPDLCDFVWSTDPQQTTQEVTDLTPGTYTVTVTYGACEETSSVSIDYSNLDINIDYESIICEGDDEYATVEVLNGQGPYTYNWSTSETESSIPLDESGNYALTVTDDFGCTQTDDFDVTIHSGIVVENFSDTECDGTSTNYYVEFDVFDTDGNPTSFFVNGNPYNNSYSQTFPTQTGYSLTVTDGNGCSSFEFVGVHDCNCETNAGTMSSLEVLSLCQNECSPDNMHNGNEFLDANDVLQFILYEGTSPITILARNSTSEFCINDADLDYEQIYYIAAIAGNDNGLGQPDPTDFCYTRSQPTPVIWHENPIAYIAHNELTTCGLEMAISATAPSPGISGTWSANANFSPTQGGNIHDPEINVIVPNFGDVVFTWTLNNAGCSDSDQITVHFNEPPVTFAGNDTIICGTEVEMNATLGTGSIGQWSANGVSFNPSSDPNATATLNSGNYGTYMCTWTETMAGCSDQDYVAITFLQEPQPNTVNNFDTICGTVYNLNVNNVNGDGIWNAYEDGTQVFPNFSPENTNPQATVTIPNYDGLFRDIEFIWTETNQSQGIQCVGEASVNVTFAKQPNAFVGTEGNYAEVCGNTYTFHADTTGSGWANGTWITDYGAISFDDQTIPDATIEITSPAVFGDSAYAQIPFQWAMTNTGCSDIDTMWVTFYKEPTANAGLDDSVCGLQYQLESFYSLPDTSNYNAFGYWSNPPDNPGSVNFNNTEDNNTLVNVGAPGSYEFVWRENNSNRPSCQSKDTVNITFIENPVIDAGDDFDVCGNVTTLSATTSGFDLSWQPVSGVVFEDYTAATTGIQYAGYGTVTFTVGESNGMCTALDEITVTFWRRPSAEQIIAEDDTTVCGRVFERLRAENPGDGVVGNWISDPANGVDFYEDDYIDTMEVLNYDHYTVWWTESTGPDNEGPDFCTDTSEPFTIHFIEPPQANAGTDTIFCGYSGNMNAVLSVDNGNSFGSWFAVSTNIT
nr:hypothetical protein [Bacteroidales bacterium]